MSGDPIAIVGIGCRFPGADDAASFWERLLEGHDAIRPFPEERLRLPASEGASIAAVRALGIRGAWLSDVYGFDARFFGLAPREARLMDPQQRQLLEVAWEALEDAGIPAPTVAGSRGGVYVSALWNDHLRLHARAPEAIDLFSLTGNTFALLANRISHALDLRGPSFTLDLGCAGSAQTIHLACEALRSGEIGWAIAGGVNLVLAPDNLLMTHRAGVLSRSGRCWTFDARADGFVPGEGVGLVVLKPLAQAEADGDRIYATIAGSAANHNGRTGWIMAVDAEAQRDLFRRSLAAAAVAPGEVAVVEMHGTGTPTGDPIEASVVGEVIGAARPEGSPVLVGSVKTNVGHPESAGSLAHLVKLAMALHHRVFPGSIGLTERNPAIDPAAMRVAIPTAPTPIPGATPPVGVLTSLSLGGGNTQLVLRGVDPVGLPPAPPGPLLLVLSARSERALERLRERWLAHLPALDGDQRYAACYAAAFRRAHHPFRLSAIGDEGDSLAVALAQAPISHAPRATAGLRTLLGGPANDVATAFRSGVEADAGRVFPVRPPHVHIPAYAWDHVDLRPGHLGAVSSEPAFAGRLDLADGGAVFTLAPALDRSAGAAAWLAAIGAAAEEVLGAPAELLDVLVLGADPTDGRIQLRFGPSDPAGRAFTLAVAQGATWTPWAEGRVRPRPPEPC